MATVEPRTVACDHCGTVLRAITRWLPEDTRGCLCMCHDARQYDRMTPTERKKRAKLK